MTPIFTEYLRRVAPHWREYQEERGGLLWDGPEYEKFRLACERILSEMRRQGIIKI